MDQLESYYLGLKAFHIIAFVAWFAVLFYLPRLFVYHTMVGASEVEANARFKTMERKLYYFIGHPALAGVLLSGIGLYWVKKSIIMSGALEFDAGYYLHLKMTAFVVLLFFHGICAFHIKRFKNGNQAFSERYFRIFNEVPTICLIAIIVAVVVLNKYPIFELLRMVEAKSA